MSALGYRRAPANGAPDRYAAVPDLRVTGGTSAALPHWRPRSVWEHVTDFWRSRVLPPTVKVLPMF
jgi:hypothetical protein